ncbi:MAG: hypothetical protein OXH31_02440 [Gammaproteobacteria bacterium]|nr:hypothetical protein [Gammaproteobacteria bacterium]
MKKGSRNRRPGCCGEGSAPDTLGFLKRYKSWTLALPLSAVFRWIASLICATHLAGILR